MVAGCAITRIEEFATVLRFVDVLVHSVLFQLNFDASEAFLRYH
jgi:hypothetical protein